MPAQKPKRILYVDHTAKLGGGEIALLNLVQALDSEKYQPVVMLFSQGPLQEHLTTIGIETHVCALDESILETRKESLGVGSLGQLSKLTGILRHVISVKSGIEKLSVDLVHTNSLKSDIIGGIAGRLANRKVVWHIRDKIDSNYLPSFAVFAFKLACALIPDQLITISKATLGPLKTIPASWASRPAQVVYDGTPILKDRDSSPSKRSKRIKIGIVGRISPWKGQHVFIEAAAKVKAKYSDCTFEIIGSAMFNEQEYEKSLHELSDRLQLSGSLAFKGFVVDVPGALKNLDIVVHASTIGEPFGQVIVEAMVAGKPVVATDGGGVPEIVENGKNGLLVPMNDADALAAAIEELIASPSKSAALASAGRRHVEENFSIERTARGVESVYESLLN